MHQAEDLQVASSIERGDEEEHDRALVEEDQSNKAPIRTATGRTNLKIKDLINRLTMAIT